MFCELSPNNSHAGVDDSADIPSDSFQNERNKLAKKGNARITALQRNSRLVIIVFSYKP